METVIITKQAVDELRRCVKEYLTEKRYGHTLGVEREAAHLGEIFLPEEVLKLRCAALLHDITKKLSYEEQTALCREFEIDLCEEELAAPKLLHAKTAAALVKRDFPQYAHEDVVSGVRWHTTGYAGMTVFESIVYLADYIEDTRTFEDCVKLREYFYREIANAKTDEEKNTVLEKTMVESFNMTIQGLISENGLVDRNTVEARNDFILRLRETERKNEKLK